MKRKYTGIIDVPISFKKQDRLNMNSFENALSKFIQFTDTPMTIAIQGEWGSGKTSLMNRLSEELCQKDNALFYSIWLNTWHFALVDNPESTLAEIINSLIDEVVKISKQEHPEKLKSLIKDVKSVSKNVFRGLSYMALKTAMPVISDEALKEFDDTVFAKGEEKRLNLNHLRTKLSDLISKTLILNQEKGITKEAFIFFIDDLDRIEPSVAVTILELLKNIFDIRDCIFILAIDYDVVVSGLKPKFGEINEANEREFRSFFDKIIQLPFRMPVQSFNIDDYLRDILLSIDFLDPEEARDHELIKSFSEFARLSLGSNPRSLKRLANSLSFISLLIQEEKQDQGADHAMVAVEKQISYAMICLQIAFPPIYNLLSDRPDFINWNDEFAQKYRAEKNSLKEPSDLQQIDLLNLKWKKIIYIVCSRSSYLSKHVYNIIQLLEKMNQICEDSRVQVGDVISEVFKYSSIINVNYELKPKFEFNPIRVFYALNNKLLPILKTKISEPILDVERSGPMIARLNYKFSEKESSNNVLIQLPLKHNNIAVKVGFSAVLYTSGTLDEIPWKNLEERGKTEHFRQTASVLIDLDEKLSVFHKVTIPSEGLTVKKNKLIFECFYQTYISTIDYLYTSKFLDQLSDLMVELANISFQFSHGDWDPK